MYTPDRGKLLNVWGLREGTQLHHQDCCNWVIFKHWEVFPYQECTCKKKEHFFLGIVELISFLPRNEFKDQFNSWVTYLEDKLLFCRDRTCADVVAGVVTKCLNARPKTKDGGIAVCLMFVEIEQQAVVQVWLPTALSFACMPMRVSVCELMQRILLWRISQGGQNREW